MSEKNAAVVMDALGMIASFFKKLVDKAKTVNALGRLYELLMGDKSDEFIGDIINLVMGKIERAKGIFPITVDYSKPLAEMIAAGKCGRPDDDITDKHFPISGQGQVELNSELVHYGKNMGSDDIVRDLESRGLRPAILPELLAFGASYPNKQREFPIVALGSVWRSLPGVRRVACLDGSDFGRRLRLGLWPGGWPGDFRFLAIRK